MTKSSKIVTVLLGAALSIAVVSLFGLKTSPRSLGSQTTLTIRGQEIKVDIAAISEARNLGLGGRAVLEPNHGMLFLFEELGVYGFWMKNMRFPLDIIWIRDGAVVGFEERVDPQIGVLDSELKMYFPPSPVDTVLELNSGMVKLLGISIGDRLKMGL
ncbi:DUF192 domain-containing protein [Candidatus Jorgensenbacteria bacterium]|nr:DUF192 domain-containing protein [Candidatus Jorgensenbacteria bacterium]